MQQLRSYMFYFLLDREYIFSLHLETPNRTRTRMRVAGGIPTERMSYRDSGAIPVNIRIGGGGGACGVGV